MKFVVYTCSISKSGNYIMQLMSAIFDNIEDAENYCLQQKKYLIHDVEYVIMPRFSL